MDLKQERLRRFLSITICIVFVTTLGNASPCEPASPCQCYWTSADIYADCSRRNLSQIPYLPEGITVLNMSSNEIRILQNGTFANLTGMRELYLNNNTINVIEMYAFQGLIRLEKLDLSGNDLRMLDSVYLPGIFKDLMNLKTLHLAKNFNTTPQITDDIQYPAKALKDLPSLTTLSIDGLTNKTFGQELEKTRLLKLVMSGFQTNCNIVSLFNATFRHLLYITELDLSNCNIEQVAPGTFETLVNLQVLDISSNIELGFRPLRHIFYGLQFTAIKVLNTTKNHRTFGIGTQLLIKDLEFFWNTSTEEWYMDSNRLQIVEPNALMLFPPSIKLLSFVDNKLAFGPYLPQVGCLSSLKVGIINDQHISHDLSIFWQEEQTKRKTSIQFHDQIKSGFIDLEKYFHERKSKVCPYFGDKMNSTWIILPPKLKQLHLKNCNLFYEIPFASLGTNSLDYIDASANILSRWRGPVLLSKLKYLDLSRNYCDFIGENMFRGTVDIETLQLRMNFLGYTLDNDTRGKIFSPLKHVKQLDLSLNRIYRIPQLLFIGLESLTTLNLSHNTLSQIDFKVEHMPNLAELYLQRNHLSTMPPALMHHLTTVSYYTKVNINLTDNPLQCTCDNLEFLEWMNSNISMFLNFSSYSCLDKGRRLVDMTRFNSFILQMQKNCPSYSWLTIFSACFIAIFMSVTIGRILYRYRWTIRYFYHMTKNRFNGYKPVPDLQESEVFRFHAFISYANEDGVFIRNELVVNLEDRRGLKLCIHERDFTPGHYIGDNIAGAIENSKKTIVLVTSSFLRSYWCKFELNMARMESIYKREGKPVILVVILEENLDFTGLPLELLEFIKDNTYLEYPHDDHGNVVFWDKVRTCVLGDME